MAPRTRIMDQLEAQLIGPDPRALRVGLAMPLKGLLAVNGHSVLQSIIVAADQIDAERHADDRPLELVLFDSSGPPDVASDRVANLAQQNLVEAFVGLHTSQTLEWVEASVLDPLPYIFVPGHEGSERREGYYCAGETPSDAQPGLEWIIRNRGVFSWAMLGADYVWPRSMRTMVRTVLPVAGAELTVDRLIPLDSQPAAFAQFAADVERSGAQGVVLNLAGHHLVLALRALRQRGLDRLVRFATTLEENVLLALGGDTSGNLYSMLHSFASLRSDRQREMDDRYRFIHGSDGPIMTNWAEHAYDGLLLLARLERLGHLTAHDLGTHDSASVSSLLRQSYRNFLAVAEGTGFQVLDAR